MCSLCMCLRPDVKPAALKDCGYKCKMFLTLMECFLNFTASVWLRFVIYWKCTVLWVCTCVCVCTKSAPWGPLTGRVSLVVVITLLTTFHSKPDLARLFRFLFSGCRLSSSPCLSFHHIFPPSLFFSCPLSLHLSLKAHSESLMPSPFSTSTIFFQSFSPFSVVTAANWWSLFCFNYTAGEWLSLFMAVKQKTQLG